MTAGCSCGVGGSVGRGSCRVKIPCKSLVCQILNGTLSPPPGDPAATLTAHAVQVDQMMFRRRCLLNLPAAVISFGFMQRCVDTFCLLFFTKSCSGDECRWIQIDVMCVVVKGTVMSGIILNISIWQTYAIHFTVTQMLALSWETGVKSLVCCLWKSSSVEVPSYTVPTTWHWEGSLKQQHSPAELCPGTG